MNKSGDEDAGNDADGEEFTIVVEGKSLTCQKCILREKSDYFRAMFDSCMVENKANEVTLHDQDYNVVLQLVEFMKTGELKMDLGTKNMKKLTEAAVMLQIEDAIESCIAYWKHSLNHETCWSLMNYSKSFNFEQLFNCAKRHALYYFNEVNKSTDFVQLDPKELLDYFGSPDLNCSCEIEILDALFKWYSYDMSARKTVLKELLPCFHGEDVPQDKWEIVQNHELVGESKEWQKHLDDVKGSDSTTENKEKFHKVPVLLVSIGGSGSEDKPCTDICKFDEVTETFQPFLSLKDVYPEVGNKMGYQVTLVGKDIYLSGGQLCMKRYSMILDVWKLDGFHLKWYKVTKLSAPRRHHGACGSHENLFIMGGFGKYRDILDTVQQYDTINDEWINLPDMPYNWFTPQAVFCDNKIFVYKTFLICLDMATLEWTTIRKTPCSTDYMNTFSPQYFDGYIYEFPFFDLEIDWFYELEMGRPPMTKMNVETGKVEEVEYSDSIEFGNKCIIRNGKFYTVDRSSNEFISGYMNDLTQWKKMGTLGKAGYGSVILAVPHYPVYKIKL